MAAPVYFTTELRCRSCGTITPPTRESPLMSDGLHPFETRYADVGDVLDLEDFDIENGFVRTRVALEWTPARALELWTCPSCGDDQWAVIAFEAAEGGWRVTAIEPSELSEAVLKRVPLVTDIVSMYPRHDERLAWITPLLAG